MVGCEVMKGQLKASTPAEYLEQLAEPRKSEVAALDALIRKTAPKLEPFVLAGILAYGPLHYKYPSGREGDWFHIGVASNQNYISLYICASDEEGYVAGRYREALPKANIGKSCVRFRRMSDLDPKALKALIREGALSPAKAWHDPRCGSVDGVPADAFPGLWRKGPWSNGIRRPASPASDCRYPWHVGLSGEQVLQTVQCHIQTVVHAQLAE